MRIPVSTSNPLPAPVPASDPLPVDESRPLGLALLLASVGAFWCVFGAVIGWVAHRALTP